MYFLIRRFFRRLNPFRRYRISGGNVKLTPIDSNITIAAAADKKILAASSAVAQHQEDQAIRHIALDGLEKAHVQIVDNYEDIHDRADSLLSKL